MSLRFILGRSKSGKTTFCLDEIKNKQHIGGRYIYIVPEQYSLQAEKEIVAKTGGIVSAVVLSFRRLAENIFTETGGISGKNLNDTGKLMILRSILFRNESKLKYFGVVCKKQGFIDNLSQEISNFYASGITPEDLFGYKEQFDENSVMALKLEDTAFIYSQYCNFIKDRYVNSDDILKIATDKMVDAEYIKDAEVWFDGFYGFTFQEYEVIKRLLIACKRVSIILTIEPKDAECKNLTIENSFYEPWDTIQRLKKICTENGISIENTVSFTENYHKTASMKRLEKEYFNWNRNIEADSRGIKLMTAETPYDEINMCAAEIIRLVRDEGLRYRDIAITTRSLSDYQEQIKLAFSHYSIPYFMDTKRVVVGHPCVEIASSIVGMAEDDLSYESVFRCLKTELTDISRFDRDLLENYVIRFGIKGKTWLDERWQWGFGKEDTAEAEDRINDIKDRAIKPFKEFYKKYRTGKHTIKEITIDLYEILEKLKLAEKLSAREEAAKSEGDIDKAQEQIRCYEMLGELMENMVALLGDDEVSIEEYQEIFQAGISGLKMGIIPAGIDNVIIGDIERTRLPNIKALFVVGVNEGTLPSLGGDTTGIFNEKEIEKLEEAGADLPHIGVRLSFEEQYLIYLGLTKPSEKLYICRSRIDNGGRVTKPSMVITRIEDIFPDIKNEEFDELSIKAVDRPVPALHRLGKGLNEGNEVWEETYKWLSDNETYKNRANLIKNATAINVEEKNIQKENIDRLFGENMYTSVSRLETFAKCPFYYYAKYSLAAQERKKYTIQTPDIGSLFHDVLEEVNKVMKEYGLTWHTITERDVVKIAEDAVERIAPDSGNRVLLSKEAYKYMLKRIKRITDRAVKVLRKHMMHGAFETLGAEIGFGMGELPPIAIKMPDGRDILLRGKIDRVDIYRKNGNGYIKIIDYKSGNKVFSLSDIYYGLQLQLLLYMDAFIKEGMPLINAEPQVGGVFYFRIMDPVIKASDLKNESSEVVLYKKFCMTGLACDEEEVLEALDDMLEENGKSDIVNVDLKKAGTTESYAVSRDKYDKIMSFANKKAAEIGQEILDGNVKVNPIMNNKSMPCDYCEYNALCRFEKSDTSKIRNLKKMSAREVWEKILNTDDKDENEK